MATDDDELYFCWDETKAASNLGKHGVSFEVASFVFDDPMRLETEDVFARGEYRNIVSGQVDSVVLAVVYTAPEEGLYRIISARLATAPERKAYEQNLFQAQARHLVPVHGQGAQSTQGRQRR